MTMISKALVGQPEHAAATICQVRGLTMRVVFRDGQDLVVTQDHDPNRVNVRVDAGKVTEVNGMG